MSDIATSILARTAARATSTAASVSMQNMQKIDANHAVALFKVGSKMRDTKDLELAVATAFDRRIRVMNGSAFRPSKEESDLIQCVVQINQITKPYNEEASVQGMSVVAANIFKDDKDQIWTKVGEGEEAVLVRKTSDDIGGILSARAALSVTTASVRVNLSEPYKVGDAIAVYDTKAERMRYGVAVENSTMIESTDKHEAVSFVPSQVLAAYASPALNAVEIAGLAPQSFDRNSGSPLNRDTYVKKLLDYYAVLYSKNGAYYQKLVGLIKNGFGAAAVPSSV